MLFQTAANFAKSIATGASEKIQQEISETTVKKQDSTTQVSDVSEMLVKTNQQKEQMAAQYNEEMTSMQETYTSSLENLATATTQMQAAKISYNAALQNYNSTREATSQADSVLSSTPQYVEAVYVDENGKEITKKVSNPAYSEAQRAFQEARQIHLQASEEYDKALKALLEAEKALNQAKTESEEAKTACEELKEEMQIALDVFSQSEIAQSAELTELQNKISEYDTQIADLNVQYQEAQKAEQEARETQQAGAATINSKGGLEVYDKKEETEIAGGGKIETYYDEDGNARQYIEYDANGNMVRKTDCSSDKGGGVSTYYDEDGNQTDRTLDFDYDPFGITKSWQNRDDYVVDNVYSRNLLEYSQFTGNDLWQLARMDDNQWEKAKAYLEEHPDATMEELNKHV